LTVHYITSTSNNFALIQADSVFFSGRISSKYSIFPLKILNNNNKKYEFIIFKITRGPRGPWVAHLRKRSKVANNREPQGHNLNNFGRGPFDDVIY